MSMRKNSSSTGNEFVKKYENIKRSLKRVYFVHGNEFEGDVTVTGKDSIFAHNDTQKHKKCARMINSNQ